MKFYTSLLFSVIVLSLTSCIKPESFDVEPHIVSVNVDKSSIRNAVEGFEFSIEFEDGDGDLGRDSEDQEANIFITDTRADGFTFEYAMPFIPPQGSADDIKGTIKVSFNETCCIYTPVDGPALPYCTANQNYPDLDTIFFEVQIVDRAGNRSNVVESPGMVIRCNE